MHDTENHGVPGVAPEAQAAPRVVAAVRRREAGADSGRLGRRLVLWLAMVAVTTTLLAGSFVYAGLFRRSVADARESLVRQAKVRAYQESRIFHEAMRMQGFLRTVILERLEAPIPGDMEDRFWRIARRDPDGAVRNGPVDAFGKAFDGTRRTGLFLNKNAELTPDLMRRLVLFSELCDAYGPVGRPLLANLYIDTPENGSLSYWPESPDWAKKCPADFDQNGEIYERLAGVRLNPARRTVWTGVYRDTVASVWVMSCVTPVDFGGRQVATIGHDVPVGNLMERFGRGVLPGGSGMLVRRDGRLIAHPGESGRMAELRGDYRVPRDGTPELRAVFEAVLGANAESAFVEVPGVDLVAAFEHLPEIDAYHVEILPRSLLVAEANGGTLLFVALLAGVLLVQFGVLVVVLGSRVINPILTLTESAARFTPIGFEPVNAGDGDDEISDLTRSFNEMGRAVALQHRQIQGHAASLESEVRKRTAELERARDLAQAANLAKSEFLANVSHELRTPLNAMVGFAQLLIEDPALSAEQRRRVNGIFHAGDHLLGLIHDTLDLSRMEVGEFALLLEPMQLDALVDDISSWVEPLCREKGLAFRLTKIDLPSAHILGDAVRVRQVLINLLTNAVKFTPRGEVTLTVSVRPVRSDTPGRVQLMFDVSDTGVGVPESRREAVFDRCARSADGGVSLGLAISRELARRMGGDIRVAESSSGGASFTFAFECDIAAAHQPAPVAAGVAPRTRCVLLVDDVATNREVLCECLQALGYHDICEAVDGEAALQRLAERHIDLVITDLSMPMLDGFGLRTRMREDIRWARIPVIAVSAGMVDRQGRTALEAGFDAFLAKPFRIAALHAAVRKFIGDAPERTPEPAPSAVSSDAPASSAAGGASRPRILVVEDDAMNREVLCGMLLHQGFDPVDSSDCVDALGRLFTESFDLVLFDFHMPHMNGAEFLRRYRAESGPAGPPPPFVCVTGALFDGEREQLEALGVRHVLEKPYRGALLRELVLAVLAEHAALRKPAA